MEEFQKIVNDVISQTKIKLEQDPSSLEDETILSFFYINEHLKDKKLSSENEFYLNDLKNMYIKNCSKFISLDIRFLIFYYLLFITDKEEIKDKFFDIYLVFDKFQNLIDKKDFIYLVFPKEELKTFIKGLTNAFKRIDFWQLNIRGKKEIIFKLFYITIVLYDRSVEPFKLLHDTLYKIYIKAIENKETELLFYLYTPLQFTWNGVSSKQEEFKYYNDVVEKKLENYILSNMLGNIKTRFKISDLKNKQKIKIAFLQERIISYSINKTFYSFLKTLKKYANNNFEIIILDLNFAELGGSSLYFVEKIKEIGFEYVDCQESFSDKNGIFYNLLEKVKKLKDYIHNREIDVLVGMHSRPEYNYLFTTRTAPLQIYWSHGNFEYDIKGIDKVISHYDSRSMKNYNFETINILRDEESWNPKVDNEIILKERQKYPEGVLILGLIGRLTKMDSIKYVDLICDIMDEFKNTIFIACGEGNIDGIIRKIEKKGLLKNRFYFPGFVDAHIYGHIIDIMPNTFPYLQGESMNEFQTKKKAFVTLQEKQYVDMNILNVKDKNDNPFVATEDDYKRVLRKLIVDEKYRKNIAQLAYDFNIKEYCTEDINSEKIFLEL